MFGLVDAIGDKFVKVIDKLIAEDNTLEIRHWLANFSTDVISNVAFGIDSNCKENLLFSFV